MFFNKSLITSFFIIVFLILPFTIHGTGTTMDKIKSLKDPKEIAEAYLSIIGRYYNSSDIDSLKIATYGFIEWCEQNGRQNEKYQSWRQYIQRMTENNMQDAAIKETEVLLKDAQQHNNQFGMACGEMCVGYNHRVFGNNTELCLEYYDKARELFEKSECYTDAYVVCLNSIQIYLSTQKFAEALKYLHKIEMLTQKMQEKKVNIDSNLMIRFYQFRVIATISKEGKQKAQKYIKETDRYYFSHPTSATKEAWFGYKILCARSTLNWKDALVYIDSLQNYHQSIGACYPGNQLFKAQTLETLGNYQEACRAYAKYSLLNDSVRTAELNDKLSKYTVQFDVDKLKMEKLELNAEIAQNRLVASIIVGILILILLLIISYFYLRTLAMNRKLDKAYQLAEKASRIKTSFIQNISHEIRTPLNSIVGFSTLIATSVKDTQENKEYASVIEDNNSYLLDMINNTIAIADMDSQTGDYSKKEFDLDKCCNECVELVREQLTGEVELVYKPTIKPLAIITVYSLIQRVLINVLTNAIKFTPRGKILFSYSLNTENNILYLIVEDTGVGIDEKYKESIFERFFKINSFTRGTGLGLAVSRQIMDIIGGRIYLDPSYKDGSRFVIEWPL